jgi:hypothetical protein
MGWHQQQQQQQQQQQSRSRCNRIAADSADEIVLLLAVAQLAVDHSY